MYGEVVQFINEDGYIINQDFDSFVIEVVKGGSQNGHSPL